MYSCIRQAKVCRFYLRVIYTSQRKKGEKTNFFRVGVTQTELSVASILNNANHDNDSGNFVINNLVM